MAAAGSPRSFMTQSSQGEVIDLNPHIYWLMRHTVNFFRLVICLQALELLSADEVEELNNNAITEEKRRHKMYTLIGMRTIWFDSLVKALLETGNKDVVVYLMEAKETAIAAGTVTEAKNTIEITELHKKVLRLEEELDFYKKCRQNVSAEALRKEIRTQRALIEKQEKQISKIQEEIEDYRLRSLQRRVNELQSENQNLQNVIRQNPTNSINRIPHQLQSLTPHITIEDKGTAKDPLDYEEYSSRRSDEFKTIGMQTANLKFEHINLHVWCLIRDLNYFKKLKTFKIKHGKLTGVAQHRQFTASLPELETFALHLREEEWMPAWNTSFESFSNSLIFYDKVQGSVLPMPKELLELTEHTSLRLKVSQRLGEIIISGLRFVDNLLQLPSVRKFPLLRLALEACELGPSAKFPTSSLSSLTLINVNIDTRYLKLLLQECMSLEHLQLTFLKHEAKQFVLEDFPLPNLKNFALSNAIINFDKEFPMHPYKLDSLYFHKCLVDPDIVKNFERIFECTKFAFTHLAAHDFLSHELLAHILRSENTKWVHMSHFDRSPKNCGYYKIMEKCLTTAGIPQSATSFVLVKDSNNNWMRLKIDKKELKKILSAMNGSDKFEAID